MKTSDDGVEFLKLEEGVRLTSYIDFAGHATIGIGHKIEKGESLDDVTLEQAEALLRRDLRRFEDIVGKLTPAPMQREFDACVSMAFNIGVAAFAASSVRKRWPDRGASADAFLIWCCAKDPKTGKVLPHPTLAIRRWRERALFLGSLLDTWTDYQRVLAELGYYPGPFDGKPGPMTMRAIEKLRAYVADGGVV